jgi:precorrin-3B methylase
LTSFDVAVETIADFLRKRIASAGKDEFAIVFYNTVRAVAQAAAMHQHAMCKLRPAKSQQG